VPAIQALTAGHALDLESGAPGVVHSVFSRAMNLEIGARLWTLLAAGRADLPLGIQLAATDFDRLGVRRGDAAVVRAGFIGIGAAGNRVVIDCRAARRWKPTPHPALAPGLAARLDLVAALSADRAWPASVGLARSVVLALRGRSALDAALRRVVGRGPGSTPAGDDVLVGILAVLTSPRSGARGAAAAQALRRALQPLLPTTPDISAHLLRQAADGLLGRDLHELLGAVLGAGDAQDLSLAVKRVIETGATSGADTCAGLIAAAAEFLRSAGCRNKHACEPAMAEQAAA
jgi:hypothetical protein